MSSRELSTGSMDGDESFDTEEGETDEDSNIFYDYYNDNGEQDFAFEREELDPEAFDYCIITKEDAENMLESIVQDTAKKLKESNAVARILLTSYNWNVDNIIQRYRTNAKELLVESKILPKDKTTLFQPSKECQVCFQNIKKPVGFLISCEHTFCHICWNEHVKVQLENRVSLGIECMKCHILVGTDNIVSLISSLEAKRKFNLLLLHDLIKTHPLFQWCPGTDCPAIVKADYCKAKRAVCSKCKTSFCFQCGRDYHAPTECAVIKKWLTKCQDDSETANYIQANTKDCPKCMICIEKNGGCNHMQCYKCKNEFCWVCLKMWHEHNGGYYECSIYKKNPAVANENSGVKAREALKKYLFYYERWHNHGASLKLEDEMRKKINQKIHEKVNNNVGTWIDWQYLLDAAYLLAKCRYTIRYTYPYAYYMGDERKDLFEYQQAQLEHEIENLSWKLEREEQYKRGDFENQMDIAEKRRRTLLKDFLIK